MAGRHPPAFLLLVVWEITRVEWLVMGFFMKVKLIFDDWRSRITGVDSIYSTAEGISLSSGDLHSGTTFDAEIIIDGETAVDLAEAIRCGYVPVFIVSLPQMELKCTGCKWQGGPPAICIQCRKQWNAGQGGGAIRIEPIKDQAEFEKRKKKSLVKMNYEQWLANYQGGTMDNHRIILGIDPGTTVSAFVIWDGALIRSKGIIPNDAMLRIIYESATCLVAIEMIECMGMPVGKAVLDTVRWIGRYEEAAIQRCLSVKRIYRHEIKNALCGSSRAKDGNIAQALKDRFGEPYTYKTVERVGKRGRQLKPERVRVPGILDGVHDDIWQALAVAVVAQLKIIEP